MFGDFFNTACEALGSGLVKLDSATDGGVGRAMDNLDKQVRGAIARCEKRTERVIRLLESVSTLDAKKLATVVNEEICDLFADAVIIDNLPLTPAEASCYKQWTPAKREAFRQNKREQLRRLGIL